MLVLIGACLDGEFAPFAVCLNARSVQPMLPAHSQPFCHMKSHSAAPSHLTHEVTLSSALPPDTRSHEKTQAISHDIHQHHVEGAVPSAPHVEGAQQARRLSGQRGLESLDVLFRSSPRGTEARQEATIRQCLPNAVLHLAREPFVSGLIQSNKGQVRR